ncbi:hypothetical protein [Pseudoalteromonas sp. S16_S37]|uniref:hypothetical protein n=1 Tax=Pseudoalteromonas sp. S16_S37 TaxID=2720228 RepID=UPI0016813A42|nr:hypothetical protein [Pseudoalteromonas sp. S16_S37]MBD1583330.1 hypothetical protein [Pseudoalteromonas sp. S16_S37]
MSENWGPVLSLQQQAIDSENLRRKLAWQHAPIKTTEALIRLANRNSVLDLLSPTGKEKFINSVTFTKAGLGGFNYEPLEYELTPTQIYKVLSLFGAQHVVGQLNGARVETKEDAMLLNEASFGFGNTIMTNGFKDYECVSGHNCYQSYEYICLGSCQ